jgi:hypothetical protein
MVIQTQNQMYGLLAGILMAPFSFGLLETTAEENCEELN